MIKLCKIGWHDWEIMEEIDFPHFEEKVISKLENRYRMDIYSNGYKYYVKKVCINCGKIIDTITSKSEEIVQKYCNKKNRQTIAKILIKNYEGIKS